MACQLGEVIDPHPDVEKGIKKGSVPTPLNSYFLRKKLSDFRHDLHQALGTFTETAQVLNSLSMAMTANMNLGSWLCLVASS